MKTTPQNTTYHVDITPKSFLVLAVGGIALFALWMIRDFVLLVIVSVIFAAFINAGVRVLRRLRIPRGVGVFIMYLFFFGIIALVLLVFLPLLFRELSEVVGFLPKGSPWAKLLLRVSDSGLSGSTLSSILGTSNVLQGVQNFWKTYLTESVVTGITTVFHVVTDALLVFVMSFFLVIKEGALNSFLRAMTPVKYESYVINLWKRVEHKIGYWFGGQFLLALSAGVLAFIGLSWIGVPYVLLLSILVMILEFIPFGLTLGTVLIVPFVMVSQGVSVGATTLIFFLILNFLEANVFQPLIVHKTVGVPLLLVIISFIAWIELIGWMGAIIAIPFAVVVLEIIYDREQAMLHSSDQNLPPAEHI